MGIQLNKVKDLWIKSGIYNFQALTEVDGMLRYLDKAENDINTAEPISIEPETLGIQLKENLVSW